MKIRYYNPANPHEYYDLKTGWSWTLFLFWGSFGIPWFCRKIPVYGLASILVCLVLTFMSSVAPNMAFMIAGLQLGASVYFGQKGNEITRDYLVNSKGWVPESQEQFARRSGFATANPSFPSSSTGN